MWNLVDRRQDRTTALDSALGHLLRAQRQRGELDLIVLATSDGTVVAADGPPSDCEELAAYAPMLARGRHFAIEASRLRGVTVHSFLVGRQELVLVLRGHTDERLVAALALAAMQGATRILRG